MLITPPEEPAVVTLRMTLAECVNVPLVPVMVSVELPVVLPATMLSVELPEVGIDAGENEYVAPAGKPLAVKLTFPVNPLSAPTVTV